MKREAEFAKNTTILAVGKFLPKIFSLITLPILTGQLTKADYGTYDLIVTLVSLLLPVVTLQIQSAAFRFLIDCRNKEKESSEIISNIFFFTLVTSVITICIFFFVFQGVSVFTKTLICFYFFIDILQQTIGMSARGLGHNDVYAIQSIILSIINAILIFILIYLGGWGLDGVLIAVIVANCVAYLYVSVKIDFFKYIHVSCVSKPLLKELLTYSWPMVPNNLSNWVLSLSDRLVITGFLGVEANAVYAVAKKIPNLLNQLQSVVVMGWQENAALASKDEDSTEYYSYMFRNMFNIVFSLTVLLIAATPLLFAVFIQGDYDDAYVQIPLLTLANFFFCMSGFLGGIYVAYKKTVTVAITTITAAGLNLAIDFLLIQRVGITAGSISSLAAYLFLFLYRMFDVRKIEKLKYSYGKMLIQVAIMTGMCFLTAQRSLVLNLANIIAAIFFAYFYNKELIKNIWLTVKKKLKEKNGILRK